MYLGWFTMHQAFLAAMVGFLGLITAAFYNAHLSRKRDDREAKRKARDLANALAAEAKEIETDARASIKLIEQRIQDKKSLMMGLISAFAPHTPYFLKNLDHQLGALPHDLTRGVISLSTCVDKIRVSFINFAKTNETKEMGEDDLTLIKSRLEQLQIEAAQLYPRLIKFAK